MSARNRVASFNHSPLATLAAAFAFGILAAHYTHVPTELWCIVTGAGTTCTVWLLWQRSEHHRTTIACLFMTFLCASATLAGIEREGITTNRVRRILDEGRIPSGAPVEVTGVIEAAAEPLPDGFSLNLRVERLRFVEGEQTSTGRIRLFVPVANREKLRGYEMLELQSGARVRMLTSLRRMEVFRNPGVLSGIELLDRNGFDATGTIKSPLVVERLDDEPVFLPLWWLSRYRAQLLARTHELFEPHTAGLLGAMLLGHDRLLTREVGERFRIGGTYHVLVISGMHITVIGFLALFAVRRFTSRPILQFIITALAVWAYVFAVGADVSVVRAGVMFTIIVLAPVFARPISSTNALGGAALLLLAWQPSSLFHPSFQLTFLSVLAITSVAVPLLAKLKETGEWRPTAVKPYPPVAPRWWRTLGEVLYWNESAWREEMRRGVWTYKLRKTHAAAWLGRMRLQALLRYFFAIVVVSACVQIVMLPLMVTLFHRVSLVALLMNLIVGIGVAAVTICALLASFIAGLSTDLATPLVRLTEALNWLMVHSIDPFVAMKALSFRVPAYTGAASLLYVLYFLPLAFLIGALTGWRPFVRETKESQTAYMKRKPLFAAASLIVLLAAVMLAHPRSAQSVQGRLQIDFLDVGQGDAALVTMPCGATLLVDGGGKRATMAREDSRSAQQKSANETFDPEYDRRSIGDAVVSEYLWWRGLSQIDYVLATHADTDHIEGLNAVARNFDLRAALTGRTPSTDPDYVQFARALAERDVPLFRLGERDVLRCGEARIEVLNPPRVSQGGQSRRSNDDSVVLLLIYGNRRILLTGDIEAKAEQRLIRTEGDALRADVVKVAHHGSRTSSSEEFVRRTNATVAVVSVGRDSPYGHPAAEVVERWRQSGAQVLTTGEHGTITVSTNGEDLRIETFVK